MGISVFRSSEDVDAPILDQTIQGSMAQLIKSVLVDGYGTGDDYKEPLGWELYEANSENHSEITEIVVKNVGGTGTYLQVDGTGISFSSNGASDRYWTIFRGFESVESYDSGLGAAPPYSAAKGYARHGINQVRSGSVPWRIIGNGKSFWLMIKPFYLYYISSSQVYLKNTWTPHFYGDYDKLYADNAFNFALIQSCTTSSNSQQTWMYGVNSTSYLSAYVLRDVYYRPGGAQFNVYTGKLGNRDQFAHRDSYGPVYGDVWPMALKKWSIVYGAYILGHLPGIRFLQGRNASDILPDKKIESDDHTLHLFYTSAGGAGNHGYFAMIEGRGYDDEV